LPTSTGPSWMGELVKATAGMVPRVRIAVRQLLDEYHEVVSAREAAKPDELDKIRREESW
jgi:hypothetical protein